VTSQNLPALPSARPTEPWTADSPRRGALLRAFSIASSALLAAGFLTLAWAAPSAPVEAASVKSGGVVAWGTATHPVVKKLPPNAKSGVVAISASPAGDDAMALKIDGTVISWGANRYGQARPPVGLSKVVAISMGDKFALALKSDGSVVAWGDDSLGQTDVPVAARSKVKAIAAGVGFAIAQKTDGSLVAWGKSAYGATTIPRLPNGSPVSNLRAISAADAVLGLRQDKSVVGWGANEQGEATVPPLPTGVLGVSEGIGFSLVLLSDGSIMGWGNDTYGQLVTPCASFDGLICLKHASGFKAFAAGGRHTVALRGDSTVAAWGDDTEHQIEVPRNLRHVMAVAAGSSFSLALVQQFAPNAPTSVTVSGGNQGAIVSWKPPNGDGGLAVTGYKVVATPGGKSCQTVTAKSCVVAPLTNGTSYTFTVTARNPVGSSPASTPSAAVVPAAIGPVLTPAPTPRPATAPTSSLAPYASSMAALLLAIGIVALAVGFIPGLREIRRRRSGLVLAAADAASGRAPSTGASAASTSTGPDRSTPEGTSPTAPAGDSGDKASRPASSRKPRTTRK